jgi:hypothetical protein
MGKISVSKCKFIYSGIILGILVSFYISYLIDDIGDVLKIELIYVNYFLYSFYENRFIIVGLSTN